MTSPTLTRPETTLLSRYRHDGIVINPALLDPATYIAPLQQQIRAVIELTRTEAGLGPTTGTAFDAGLAELLKRDRSLGGRIYDAVRKLPGFFAIANAPEIWQLVGTLMETGLPGWFAAGSGIRMDHPDEDRHLAPWHQDYHYHLCSEDMLVLWIPLAPVDETAGRVVFCPESHRGGMLPVYLDDPLNERRDGVRVMEFVDAPGAAARYEQRSFDTAPGDVIAFHGLLLHRLEPEPIVALPLEPPAPVLQLRGSRRASPRVDRRHERRRAPGPGAPRHRADASVVKCRLCGDRCRLILHRSAPALTSAATRLDIPTLVYACGACGLVQSPPLPAADAYYEDSFDTNRAHPNAAVPADDLMGVDANGAPILRLQRQAEILAARLDDRTSGRLLDFGCGHGATLQWFRTNRPAWHVEGFEVAARYAAPGVAIGAIPDGPFDAIAAFFVFEHLDEPVIVARQLASRLAPGGRLLLAVPDAVANPVDVLAVDHVSHFDRSTLTRLLAAAGLALVAGDSSALPATWLVEGRASDRPIAGPPPADGALPAVAAYWRDADAAITSFLNTHPPAPQTVAIYGAGVWGLSLLTHPALPDDAVACFADRNPRKQGTSFHGLPVVAPASIPATVETVLIGVRPESAPAVESQPDLAPFRRLTMPPWRASCEA